MTKIYIMKRKEKEHLFLKKNATKQKKKEYICHIVYKMKFQNKLKNQIEERY